MRKRTRQIPQGFDESVDTELDEYSDDDLAARYRRAEDNEDEYTKGKILGAFRRRTGQEPKR